METYHEHHSDWLIYSSLANQISRGLNPQNPNRFFSKEFIRSNETCLSYLLHFGQHLPGFYFKRNLTNLSAKMVKTRSKPSISVFYNKHKVSDKRHSNTFSSQLEEGLKFFISLLNQVSCFTLCDFFPAGLFFR